jgi:RNA polymerase sigma-70 factor (ECF subfamily)
MEPSELKFEPSSGGAEQFCTTHWSVVLLAGEEPSTQAAEALEKLCLTYWYPLYAYTRRLGYDPPDAQDLTQGFFARLLEKGALQSVERRKGKFRSFLLASLNHFLANERDRARAAKRGGGQIPVPLDADQAEDRYRQEPHSDLTPERIFERQWALAVLARALDRLGDEFSGTGRAQHFALLKSFLTSETTDGAYAAAAAQLNVSSGYVAVTVHRMRQRYRELVRAEVADTVASPGEIDDEMRSLFAALS